ncbi:MAG: RNA polymerase sigma factor [Verrucomicrobiales bacterium]
MFDDLADTELMLLLADGQDLALNELVRRWRERVAAFLLRMTHDRGTALDLTQETFVRLYRSRTRYRANAAFPSFLFTVAANLARDHARWRKRHPSVPLEDATATRIPDTSVIPDAAAANREELAAVESAISELPSDLREALLLYVYEDLGYGEIASILGCTPKAVETRIYRARQMLKANWARGG